MRIVVTSTLTKQLRCLFSSSGWLQAKSLKFEDQGKKGSWLHLFPPFMFLLFSHLTNLLLILSRPELEEGNLLDSQNSCLMLLWKWSHCLLTLQMLKSDFFSRDFHGFSEASLLPMSAASRCPAAPSPKHPLKPPQGYFWSGAKHNHLNSLSLRNSSVHRKHHLPRQTLRMQLLSHTLQSLVSISAVWASQRPVSFKCREAHVKLCRWFYQSPCPLIWGKELKPLPSGQEAHQAFSGGSDGVKDSACIAGDPLRRNGNSTGLHENFAGQRSLGYKT